MANKAKKENTEVMPWDNYEGSSGFEAVTQQDLGIPFIDILQDLSPQVKPKKPEYIEGAKVGDIYNPLTQTIMWTEGDEPLELIPLFYERLYVEWKPRGHGGGLVQIHGDASVLSRTKRNDKNEDVIVSGEGQGNIIQTTGYLQVAYDITNSEGPQRAVIAFKSTQLKKIQGLLNKARALRVNGRPVPLFSHTYKFSVMDEGNDKGDWNGWKIELGTIITDPAVAKQIIKAQQIVNKPENRTLLPLTESNQATKSSQADNVAQAEIVDEEPF